jgi:hypothetical protein
LLGEMRLVRVIAEYELELAATNTAERVLFLEREVDTELHACTECLVCTADRRALADQDRCVLRRNADGNAVA